MDGWMIYTVMRDWIGIQMIFKKDALINRLVDEWMIFNRQMNSRKILAVNAHKALSLYYIFGEKKYIIIINTKKRFHILKDFK